MITSINNEIKEEFEEYHEEQEKFIDKCWKIKDENKQKLDTSEIQEIIKNLEDEKAGGPNAINNDEMIKEGGKSMKNSVIRMMKIIY